MTGPRWTSDECKGRLTNLWDTAYTSRFLAPVEDTIRTDHAWLRTALRNSLRLAA